MKLGINDAGLKRIAKLQKKSQDDWDGEESSDDGDDFYGSYVPDNVNKEVLARKIIYAMYDWIAEIDIESGNITEWMNEIMHDEGGMPEDQRLSEEFTDEIFEMLWYWGEPKEPLIVGGGKKKKRSR